MSLFGRFLVRIFVVGTAVAVVAVSSAAGFATARRPDHSGSSVRLPLGVKVFGRLPDGRPRLTGTAPTGLPPAAIASVYDLPGLSPSSGAGAGQVIAIVDAYDDPKAQADLNTFSGQYGYPQLPTCTSLATAAPPCFEKVYAQGKKPSPDGHWAVEESLDIEWAHAEAPAAKIVLVETSNGTSNGALFGGVVKANRLGATEVSMSWYEPDFATEATFDSDMKHPGTFYVAAAGDHGHEAAYPAASPDVIAVGGTTLNGCSGTSCAGFTSETAWAGSGGGVSAFEPIPGYQNNYKGPVSGASSISALTGGKRAIPDVSFDANMASGVSVYDSTPYKGQTGWFSEYGTSVGAPNWAGILAAAAPTRRASLQGNAAIYSGGYAANLRDIITGTNGSCGAACTAGRGYDLMTGLGSPSYRLWGPGLTIETTGAVTSISCPTASFCMAADNGGNVYTYTRGTWSAGQRIDSDGGLTSISCPTASFCAATSTGSTAYIYSAGTWSASQLVGANLTSVSCPAAGSCLATGDEASYTYSGGTWSQGQLVQQAHTFTSISCPTTSFCEAADSGGEVYTYSKGTWSAGQQVGSDGGLASISCATTSFCAATSTGATAYIYSAGTWSASQLVGADGGSANLTSVSCPAAGSCLATGDWNSYTYSGGTWAQGQLIQQGDVFTSVSCPTTSFCKAADDVGRIYTYSTN